jgi:uncharacterized membrane protein YkvA (DUF1232 family)
VRVLLIAIAISLIVWLAVIATLALAGRRVAARHLVRLVPDLVALMRGLLCDARVPRSSKLLVGLAGVWLVCPIDLVPESIPLLGPLDDVIVAALVLRHLAKSAGPDVLADHWRGEPAALERIMQPFRRAGRITLLLQRIGHRLRMALKEHHWKENP